VQFERLATKRMSDYQAAPIEETKPLGILNARDALDVLLEEVEETLLRDYIGYH